MLERERMEHYKAISVIMCLMLITILYEYAITVNLYRSNVAFDKCKNNMQWSNKQTNKCIYITNIKKNSSLLALENETELHKILNDQDEGQNHCHLNYSKEMYHSV